MVFLLISLIALNKRVVVRCLKRLGVLIGFGLFSSVLFAHPIKIIFWHSMAGQMGAALEKMIDGFNHSQNQYEIIGIYKGDYNETMTALVAAYRAHEAPAMCQIFEIGTATMMSAQSAIVPVYQLMQSTHHAFNASAFLAPIAAYYSDQQDHLVSMPFNVSSAVMYYNKTAFIKAGLNPNQPPRTWPEVQRIAEQLQHAGFECAYTTAWPAWIQLEVFSAWHNLPYADQQNGLGGIATQVLYNNPQVMKQLKTLLAWQKSGFFEYGGRGDNANALFTSGHCVMMTQSSGARSALVAGSHFDVGVSALPYWPNVVGAPQNTSIGGASIWVMKGYAANVYAGIADFFAYMMQPQVQVDWQRDTGYLPVTIAAYQLAKQTGYYAQTPGSDVAMVSLLNKPPTAYSKGIRLGNFMQIRDINDTAIEGVFSGAMTVQEALAYAQDHANHLLKRFAELVD